MSWLDKAACKGTLKPEVFFDPYSVRSALAVCRACEVMMFCRAEGDAVESLGSTFGVRGGETESVRIRRRAAEWKAGKIRAPRPINHGTEGGYQTHRRRGEPACDACLKANSQASSLRASRQAS
jgi:hypothetical protein